MSRIQPRGRAALICAGVVGVIGTLLVLPTQGQQNTKQAAKAPAKAAPKQAVKSKYVSPAGYIGGTVTSEKGPEAGVWVIAETKDTQTPFIKIVVTDDQG